MVLTGSLHLEDHLDSLHAGVNPHILPSPQPTATQRVRIS